MTDPSTSESPAPSQPLEPRIRRLCTDPPRFRLGCPECDEDLGEHRFEPLARRAFGEHVDDRHPVPSPLEVILAAVVLQTDGPGRWTCDINGATYEVRLPAPGRYVVHAATRGATVRTPMRSLSEAQITIAAMERVVRPALIEAATLELARQDTPAACGQ